jgi:hypothetical protein
MESDGVLRSAYLNITRNRDACEAIYLNSNHGEVTVLECEPNRATEILALESSTAEDNASLGRFFAARVVLVGPELRSRRLEFHSKLVESGWLFASGPNDMAPNAQAGFLTVNSKHCALRPINGR